jgi:hypothetical protein
MKLYVDTDENGEIISMLAGANVVPTEEFQHEFDVDPGIVDNLYKYKIVDGVLTQKDKLPEVFDNNPQLTPIEQIQKDQADLLFQLMMNGVL